MGKKKSCQNVRIPRPLNAVERGLYGWVEETIFTQPSVLEDSLPELCRHMSLTENTAAEGDFVLEAVGPSDRLLFQASEGTVYPLGGPFAFYGLSEGGHDAMSGGGEPTPFKWLGLLRTFERVCLHFGFRPTSRLFLYIYDILIPPSGYGFIYFRVRQGCKLFGIFEESIQEFKWHYFKVLFAPGRRMVWLDDGGMHFPWVYWNRRVKDFVVHELDPLEMVVFDFLVSLPAGLPKKNNLTCRLILDNNDAVDDSYDGRSDKDGTPVGSTDWCSCCYCRAAVAASAAPTESSANLATPSVQVPPPTPVNSIAKKSSSKRERPEVVSVEGEEGAKEDPDTDLKQKRHRKEKGKERIWWTAC
ncbi:hypothetical protein PIB30_000369 [Stylosanthes scabra]|uniref:DUF4283 domain-containing protein n=1 Tax=Stylosanthes scabra TaxID=79078 RepID=A0ABU6U153_9FABA|nr:hypothetical protein [Stylosanthes scabra]